MSIRCRCGAALWVLFAAVASPVAADQEDVPVVLRAPDGMFAGHAGAAGDWLTATATRVDIAGYPIGVNHTWHGRIGVDVTVAEISPDTLYRMGLSMQTLADHRNDIAFRLVRLYYDATQLVEQRFGDGVLHAGLRHRCTHGADAVTSGGEEGRVLIHSGPQLGYHHAFALGALQLSARGFVHATMIGQNKAHDAQTRLLAAAALQAALRSGSLELFASGGFGAALQSEGDDSDFGFGSAWRGLSLEPLPAAALGLRAHGAAASFDLVLHYQRVADTGFGQGADPESVMSVELGFTW